MRIILIQAVDMFFGLLDFLIFVRVILSWIPIGRGNPIIQLLYTLTEPILAPIRSLLDKSPLGGMMLDFSAVFALILLYFIRMLLLNFLIGY
ncbi:MAG TPA: YggT family protein [Candidatus Coprocola pullicola]|nr:YggT family protein [Candidatus Coprocola pullicola]